MTRRTGDGSGVMVLVPPAAAAAREIDEAANAGMAILAPDGGERYARFWAWIEGVHPPEGGPRVWFMRRDPDR